jgi:hypothetical protein
MKNEKQYFYKRPSDLNGSSHNRTKTMNFSNRRKKILQKAK